MASATVKATYSLDPGTVSRLEEIARRWGTSKSEALRRAIRAAAGEGLSEPDDPLAALEALQRGVSLTPARAAAWSARARRERRDTSRRAERARR